MISTPWNGNSKRVGGLKQKCPRGGGRGGEYFLDYTIVKLFYYFIDFKLKESHKFISSNYNCQVLPSLNEVSTSLHYTISEKENKELDRLCLNLP